MYVKNGKIDTKLEEQENEKQERKLEDCFDSIGWLFCHMNTRFPRMPRLHMSLARMYFVKVWYVVLLHPVCVLLSVLRYVYKSNVSVAVSRDLMTSARTYSYGVFFVLKFDASIYLAFSP